MWFPRKWSQVRSREWSMSPKNEYRVQGQEEMRWIFHYQQKKLPLRCNLNVDTTTLFLIFFLTYFYNIYLVLDGFLHIIIFFFHCKYSSSCLNSVTFCHIWKFKDEVDKFILQNMALFVWFSIFPINWFQRCFRKKWATHANEEKAVLTNS